MKFPNKFHVRLEDNEALQLMTIAEAEDRSLSQVIRYAIKHYLATQSDNSGKASTLVS